MKTARASRVIYQGQTLSAVESEGQLLLADRFLIQTSLILVYLRLQRRDGVFSVRDFRLIGS